MVVDKSYFEEEEEEEKKVGILKSNIACLKDMAWKLSSYYHREVNVVSLDDYYFFTIRKGLFRSRKPVGHAEKFDIEYHSDKDEITIYCYTLDVAEFLDKKFGADGYTFKVSDVPTYFGWLG